MRKTKGDENMGKKVVRKRLAEVLKSRGITAYKLAAMLGYKDKTSVYKWVYGVGQPNAATMLKLMLLLDITAREVLEIFAEGSKEVKEHDD